MYFGLALWWRQQLLICCILLWFNLVLALGFITLRFELIVIHFYVQKFGKKIFLSQHVCKIKTRTFCYFMKSPFITVSLSHSLSLRIVLLMQQYQEGKRCKVQFYHLYFKSFIRMSTFFCNKALSPYNNIPFHVLLLLIAAKAFFSLCFLRWQLKMRTLFILLIFLFDALLKFCKLKCY